MLCAGVATLCLGISATASGSDGLFTIRLAETDRWSDVRTSLEAQNLRLIGLIDDRAALVRASEATLIAWAGGRAIERLDVERKAAPELSFVVRSAESGARGVVESYLVIPSDRSREARRRVAQLARTFGGDAQLVESNGLTMRVMADGLGLLRLLESADVLWVEREEEPSNDDEFVREFGGANYVELIDGFTGFGVVGEVMDSGIMPTHLDFSQTPPVLLTGNTSSTAHGTSSYGVIFGRGDGDPTALGMMPCGVGLFSSYLQVMDRDAHLATLAGPPYYGVLQSNSWGSGINRRYSAASAAMDDSIMRHDVVVLQSQSNQGTPDSRPEAWAKNIVSVGGVQGKGTLDRDDDTWGWVASCGPALDGRIKPDLVMFNDGIWTTSDAESMGYRVFTGTSAATPAVAGHFGIMIEMWRSGLFHNQPHAAQSGTQADGLIETGSPLSTFMPAPSVSMSRALMINSARPYEFGHVAEDLGRYRQGWGTPDLRKLRDAAPRMFVLDESHPLEEGNTWARVFEVSPGEAELRVTMVYQDPAALPFSVIALVNDLDLRVTSPSGVVYLGNWGLHDGVWSLPGGERDRVNTVENVFVHNPEPGAWLVETIARRVVVDAGPGTPAVDVPFSLVASGVTLTSQPPLSFAGHIPDRLEAGEIMTLEFQPYGLAGAMDGVLLVEHASGVTEVPLLWNGSSRYSAQISGLVCGESYALRAIAPGAGSSAATWPAGGDGWVVRRATTPMEIAPVSGTGWQTEASPGLTTGHWQFGAPAGGGLRWDPPIDADGDGVCWLTDNRAGNSDVSGGSARLVTPAFDLRGVPESVLEVALWVACDDAGREGEDTLIVEYSTNNGADWSFLAEERSTFRWVNRAYRLEGIVEPASRVRFRFTIADMPDNSITEAGVDAMRVIADGCGWCEADFNHNGILDLMDLHDYLVAFFAQLPDADLDRNGTVDLIDLIRYLILFNEGCAW